jgi:hypothetical protein
MVLSFFLQMANVIDGSAGLSSLMPRVLLFFNERKIRDRPHVGRRLLQWSAGENVSKIDGAGKSLRESHQLLG